MPPSASPFCPGVVAAMETDLPVSKPNQRSGRPSPGRSCRRSRTGCCRAPRSPRRRVDAVALEDHPAGSRAPRPRPPAGAGGGRCRGSEATARPAAGGEGLDLPRLGGGTETSPPLLQQAERHHPGAPAVAGSSVEEEQVAVAAAKRPRRDGRGAVFPGLRAPGPRRRPRGGAGHGLQQVERVTVTGTVAPSSPHDSTAPRDDRLAHPGQLAEVAEGRRWSRRRGRGRAGEDRKRRVRQGAQFHERPPITSLSLYMRSPCRAGPLDAPDRGRL